MGNGIVPEPVESPPPDPLTNGDEDELEENLKNWPVKEAAVKEVILTKLSEETEQTKGQKFWSFLNQSFTLWLLSSLFVGGISWGYTEWQESFSERQRTLVTIERLDIEIASRVTTALGRLNSATSRYSGSRSD